MIASVYIKDGYMHIYSERKDRTNIGGVVVELGRPVLDFVCCEQDRFDESFDFFVQSLDSVHAHIGIKEPAIVDQIRETATAMQTGEIYMFFYHQIFYDFIFKFVDDPQAAIEQLAEFIPAARGRLAWVGDFRYPASDVDYIEVIFTDHEKRLHRAAKGVVSLLSDHFKKSQAAMINEVNLLLNFREVMPPPASPMAYLYWLEKFRQQESGSFYYLESRFHSFYGVIREEEIAEMYEINTVVDLFRFEFVKMIEHDIFIKRCKNCGRFFIPRGRSDSEYCSRSFGDTGRRCSEVGAMLRYEQKVADNPILDAHKKAYRRFNSRTRAKKMTQAQFMSWADEAARRRDECLAGRLPFDEFVAWLEQGRIRKSRGAVGETKTGAAEPGVMNPSDTEPSDTSEDESD